MLVQWSLFSSLETAIRVLMELSELQVWKEVMVGHGC